MGGSAGAQIVLSGVAVVCCVHNREKREVIDPEHVKFLGKILGVEYDPTKHKLQVCACCENLHVRPDDTPSLCDDCQKVPTYVLHAPVPSPLEECF